MIEERKMTAEEAVAEAWASIDGKLDAFTFERDNPKSPEAEIGGHYEGYMAEAREMIRRLEARGYTVRALQDAPPPAEITGPSATVCRSGSARWAALSNSGERRSCCPGRRTSRTRRASGTTAPRYLPDSSTRRSARRADRHH
jgi:hypothetical protein